jgi:hypothetical protein
VEGAEHVKYPGRRCMRSWHIQVERSVLTWKGSPLEASLGLWKRCTNEERKGVL